MQKCFKLLLTSSKGFSSFRKLRSMRLQPFGTTILLISNLYFDTYWKMCLMLLDLI